MTTEEVFIVHFTLKAYELNYDELENPKISMIESLCSSYDDNVCKRVWGEILNIPNELMRKQIIDFLFRDFLKFDRTNPGDAYAYKTLKQEETYYYFEVDSEFANYLIVSYYIHQTDNRLNIHKSNALKNINKDTTVIDVNTKLQNDIEFIVTDFLRCGLSMDAIFDILKTIIFDDYTFHADCVIKCENELYEIYFYRNYLKNLILSEIYEDILYAESAMGGKVESPLYRINEQISPEDFEYNFDDEYEIEDYENETDQKEEDPDAEFEEFNEIVKLLANNKGLGFYLPSEFYIDLVGEYFYIITDEERHKSNRTNMIKSHQRILKKLNPLYMFDNM